MAEKMTRAQKRELENLRAGRDADGAILERAGLVSVFTEITLVGRTLSKVERWTLTERGRSALASTGGTDAE